MKIALAWMDLTDPTDCNISENLALELRKLGHSSLIVGPRKNWNERFFELFEDIPVYHVGFPHWRWLGFLNGALSLCQLLWINVHEAIDVWHCHLLGPGHHLIRWTISITRCPLLVTIQLVLKEYLSYYGNLNGIRRMARLAFGVTAPSQAVADQAVELCPELRDKISIVYNGARLMFNSQDNLHLPKPYILSVARLARYKGPDLLVMAFARLLDQGHDIHLVIAGNDHLKGGLGKFVQELGLETRVHLTGQLPRTQITRLLKECLFFALSSREEPFGIAVLEAMACKKAVVATRVGGIPEIVRDGLDGILVPARNVDALADGLRQMLENVALREQLARSAARRSQKFTWDQAALKYAELYKMGYARSGR